MSGPTLGQPLRRPSPRVAATIGQQLSSCSHHAFPCVRPRLAPHPVLAAMSLSPSPFPRHGRSLIAPTAAVCSTVAGSLRPRAPCHHSARAAPVAFNITHRPIITELRALTGARRLPLRRCAETHSRRFFRRLLPFTSPISPSFRRLLLPHRPVRCLSGKGVPARPEVSPQAQFAAPLPAGRPPSTPSPPFPPPPPWAQLRLRPWPTISTVPVTIHPFHRLPVPSSASGLAAFLPRQEKGAGHRRWASDARPPHATGPLLPHHAPAPAGGRQQHPTLPLSSLSHRSPRRLTLLKRPARTAFAGVGGKRLSPGCPPLREGRDPGKVPPSPITAAAAAPRPHSLPGKPNLTRTDPLPRPPPTRGPPDLHPDRVLDCSPRPPRFGAAGTLHAPSASVLVPVTTPFGFRLSLPFAWGVRRLPSRHDPHRLASTPRRSS